MVPLKGCVQHDIDSERVALSLVRAQVTVHGASLRELEHVTPSLRLLGLEADRTVGVNTRWCPLVGEAIAPSWKRTWPSLYWALCNSQATPSSKAAQFRATEPLAGDILGEFLIMQRHLSCLELREPCLHTLTLFWSLLRKTEAQWEKWVTQGIKWAHGLAKIRTPVS